MRLTYVLLSATFGMHQYTADLANRMAQAGHEVHLVTTAAYPAHRYLPAITVHTPIATRGTGFSPEGLDLPSLRRAIAAVMSLTTDNRPLTTDNRLLTTDNRPLTPDNCPLPAVHITGPHLWNLFLLAELRRARVPVAHTLHDLDPHLGTPYGPLLHLWNREVLRLADHILIHGARYRDRLLRMGLPAGRITCTPLLHLFLGYTWLGQVEDLAATVRHEPAALCFGRLERYKGIDYLLTAWAMLARDGPARLILAGPGKLEDLWAGALPPGVELHNHLIEDVEALELFRRCGLLILPYTSATQSALIPAAYFFRKPVIAAPSGALDEYVADGETGWIVEPEHPASLARCLAHALADPERLARMGAAGRAWYDGRRAAEERILHRMYEQLAGG